MEEKANILESLWDKVEDLGLTTLELTKLKALETVSNVTTSMIARISVITSLLLFLLIFNIGIAFLLGDILGKTSYGFFIVAVFYLLAAIILHFFLHRWIKNSVSELIINKALQQNKIQSNG
ncbi:MAG: hypothetical protein IPM42_14600 [Saprospiraceae bacterium]|nr:hypothetical protein [Saprospiraceae bacterium]